MKDQFFILTSSIQASLGKLGLILAAFLLPIKPLIIIVGVCIAIDTFMGIWRSRKMKEKITSRKLSNIVSKMVLYQAAIILFFCIEKYILADFIGAFTSIPLIVTKLIAATLVFIELKSMDESFQIIFKYSLWDKFKDMVKRSKSLKGELEDFNKKTEN